jgi:hypothetical protein
MSTTAPTMMRTIFMPLSLEIAGVGTGTVPGAAVAGEESGEVTGVDARIAVPHLLQNRVPGVRFAPQELQKAMVYLA